jgi:hypothetical protein
VQIFEAVLLSHEHKQVVKFLYMDGLTNADPLFINLDNFPHTGMSNWTPLLCVERF